MQQLTIGKNQAGQRLDKFLKKAFPNAGTGFLYKMLRKKNITLNGKKAEGKEILAKAGITEADLDAWYLLEFVTGITKARYYMDPDQSMDPEAWKKYKEYLEKN